MNIDGEAVMPLANEPSRISSTPASAARRPGFFGPRFLCGLLALLSIGLVSSPGISQELMDFRSASLGGGQTQLVFRFSAPPPEPRIFVIDSPARIAIDLPGVSNQITTRNSPINQGAVTSLTTVEADDRTRLIVNLNRSTDYNTQVDGSNLVLVVGPGAGSVAGTVPAAVAPVAAPTPEAPAAVTAPATAPTIAPAPAAPMLASAPPPADSSRAGVRSARPPEITQIDFRRGIEGQGRVIIELSRPGVSVDVREQADRIELVFPSVLIDSRLQRRINVVDFATPVTTIDTLIEQDNQVRLIVNAVGDYDVLSYQSGTAYVLEVAPMTDAQRAAQRIAEDDFVGERLSLNFQDIEVRSVLQLLADFTDLNIVVADSVVGNITLRLNNVPWDQALDIILRTRGLDKRQTGNVIYVAPQVEIAAREREQLQSERDRQELAPLRTEYIAVNFTTAKALRDLIAPERGSGVGDLERRFNLLSDRGSVTADERSNTLIVRDNLAEVQQIRRLVAELDKPTRQVMIETRIVIADDRFARDLGVRFGTSAGRRSGVNNFGLAGNLAGSDAIAQGLASRQGAMPPINDRLNWALPIGSDEDITGAPSALGQIAFTLLRPNVLLDLELRALQFEGRGEVISNPRVITENGKEARIRRAEKIPYLKLDDSGNTVTEFQDAALETKVKPQITPNGNIILELTVEKSEPNPALSTTSGIAITERLLETSVTVANGETVVLGGIFEISSFDQTQKIPFLGDVPFLRHLFQDTARENTKAELLIFVTPRLLN